jgi:hypothetical protein
MSNLDQVIGIEFNFIVKEIEGASLYGEPINPADRKAMVVAAYHAGLARWQSRAVSDDEIMRLVAGE